MANVQCPTCGGRDALPDDVLARSAGQRVFCQRCGTGYRLPPLAKSSATGAGGATGKSPRAASLASPAAAAPAKARPATIVQSAQQATLDYESPIKPAAPGWPDCRRVVIANGERLVMRDGASTPDRCVLCNAPAGGYRKRINYRTPVDSTTSGGAGAGSGIFGVIMLIVMVVELFALMFSLSKRQSCVVHLAVCKKCRDRAFIWRMIALLMGLGGLATLIIAVATAGHVSESEPMGPARSACLVLGIVAMLAAMIVPAAIGRMPRYMMIVNQEIWLKGAGPAFLASLPTVDNRTVANKK